MELISKSPLLLRASFLLVTEAYATPIHSIFNESFDTVPFYFVQSGKMRSLLKKWSF
jgi:hypothetical protein